MNDELDEKLTRMIYLEQLIQKAIIEKGLETALWLVEQREQT